MQREPIDLDHLARQTLGDSALEREVLALFTAQARLLAGRIGEAATEEERRMIHTMKGAASGVGAFAVAEGAARIEREPDREEWVAPLQALVEEACGFIETLGEPAAGHG